MYYHKIDSDMIKKKNKGLMGAGNVSTLGSSYVYIHLIIIQILIH